MSLFAAAVAVFPSMTLEQLMWDVSEAFLYQAETIYAARMGLDRVKSEKAGASDGFRKRWEVTTGKKWPDAT